MFTLAEIGDLLLMTVAVAYIFSDLFSKKAASTHDPIAYWKSEKKNNFLFAMYVTAPAIILHELAHKLVALSFGIQAVFHAAYTWLGLGVILKVLNTGLIFFVPGYVQIMGTVTAVQHVLISGAGPFTNLVLFLIATLILKYKKGLSGTWIQILGVSKKLNLFLFFFNMIPIPPFDGFSVFRNLISIFF